ncbi:MAG: HK97 gp10 family phage protein [Methanobrevibacter sp.]|nr:HK97 gp10 family phage protein [Methanobrevibacter sp.]
MASKDFVNQAHKNSHGNVYVDVSDVVSGLYRFANFTRGAARSAAKETADDLERSMKANAPWQDRTGRARESLHAEYFEEPAGLGNSELNVGVKLQHGVPYGVFLEYNGLYNPEYYSRRRPILVPTMESKEAIILLTKLKNEFSKIAKV